MRAVLGLVTLCVLSIACRTNAVPTGSPNQLAPIPADTALRSELIRIGKEDQQGRENIPLLISRNDTAQLLRLLRLDSAHTRRIKDIVARQGWPTRALVGKEGVQAAWLVLQHSPDNAWQEEMLPIVERSAAAGDISRWDVATLTDRVLIHAGKPQRYGNSFSVKDGRLVADPIEDMPHLESRRAAMGLPPMTEYVRQLGELYKVPVEWPPKTQ